jgi:hypothetical protein
MTAKFQTLILVLALGVGPAVAQQVGTTTAVNPSTEGTPPGGTTSTLTIGARVLHKERIHTSSTGSVQLLFLDKSTLSIAPNTSLVIDEFVYDPASNSGHMLTKLTQGTLQYVGGQLSHQGAVTITTPAATIGIRGGIGVITVGPSGTQASNVKGILTAQNGATTTQIITGFTLNIAGWNTPPGPPFPTPPELVIHNITIVSSVNGQTGGGPSLHNLPTLGFTCGASATPACPQSPWQPTNTGENDATQIIGDATHLGSQPNPPPPVIIPDLGNRVR